MRVHADDGERAGFGETLNPPAQRERGRIAGPPRFSASGPGLRGDALDFLVEPAAARSQVLRRRPAVRALRVDADRVDRTVDAYAPVKDRIASTGSSALKSMTSAPCARAISRRDGMWSTANTRPAPRSFALVDTHLADRAAPEYDNRVARTDLCQLCAEVAGGKDIREQDGLVVSDLVGEFHRPYVCKRNPCPFRLQALKGARTARTAEEGRPRAAAVRVGVVALGIVPLAAIRTVPRRRS